MKIILLAAISCLAINLPAYAGQISKQSLGFTAPTVPDAEDSAYDAEPVGSIVFSVLDQKFKGRIQDGSWVNLSPTLNSFQQSTASSTTSWPVGTGVWFDLASLSLPAGEWELICMFAYTNSAALVSTTNLHAGISTTSGNSASGLSIGNNYVAAIHSPTSGDQGNLVISNYRVTPSSTTTYYCKGMSDSHVTNLDYSGYRFSARPIN